MTLTARPGRGRYAAMPPLGMRITGDTAPYADVGDDIDWRFQLLGRIVALQKYFDGSVPLDDFERSALAVAAKYPTTRESIEAVDRILPGRAVGLDDFTVDSLRLGIALLRDFEQLARQGISWISTLGPRGIIDDLLQHRTALHADDRERLDALVPEAARGLNAFDLSNAIRRHQASSDAVVTQPAWWERDGARPSVTAMATPEGGESISVRYPKAPPVGTDLIEDLVHNPRLWLTQRYGEKWSLTIKLDSRRRLKHIRFIDDSGSRPFAMGAERLDDDDSTRVGAWLGRAATVLFDRFAMHGHEAWTAVRDGVLRGERDIDLATGGEPAETVTLAVVMPEPGTASPDGYTVARSHRDYEYLWRHEGGGGSGTVVDWQHPDRTWSVRESLPSGDEQDGDDRPVLTDWVTVDERRQAAAEDAANRFMYEYVLASLGLPSRRGVISAD